MYWHYASTKLTKSFHNAETLIYVKFQTLRVDKFYVLAEKIIKGIFGRLEYFFGLHFIIHQVIPYLIERRSESSVILNDSKRGTRVASAWFE